jgi:hypothetical protein
MQAGGKAHHPNAGCVYHPLFLSTGLRVGLTSSHSSHLFPLWCFFWQGACCQNGVLWWRARIREPLVPAPLCGVGVAQSGAGAIPLWIFSLRAIAVGWSQPRAGSIHSIVLYRFQYSGCIFCISSVSVGFYLTHHVQH